MQEEVEEKKRGINEIVEKPSRLLRPTVCSRLFSTIFEWKMGKRKSMGNRKGNKSRRTFTIETPNQAINRYLIRGTHESFYLFTFSFTNYIIDSLMFSGPKSKIQLLALLSRIS